MTNESFELPDELPPEALDAINGADAARDGKQQKGDAGEAAPKADRAARVARKPRAKKPVARIATDAEAVPAGVPAGVGELEAQGFTHDEAIRLIHVSDRVATSGEAREAEETVRRLRFTRWLIERGLLDEWSA